MKEFNYKTYTKQLMADLHTPVSVYLKVRDLFPQSALLEGSDYQEGADSNSYIALNPIGSVAINHGQATLKFPDGKVKKKEINATYRADNAINDFISQFGVQGQKKEVCGLYGFTTFNAVQYFENISIKDSYDETNDAPDMLYVFFKYVLVFNHENNLLTLIELLKDGETPDLSSIEEALSNRNFATYNFKTNGKMTSTTTDEEHKAFVRKGIEHCMRGDVFQVVLSRRFIQPYQGDDFKVYRALRSINPSPYLFYFDFGGYRIFGSSPETHCRIENRSAYIDPIAGTTKRTGNSVEDKKLADALLNDPKENAEHVMLVDLARNDLGRNCDDVHVVFYKEPQYYSHVIHLVSRVQGTLMLDADPVKSFIDTFPAGTLSGAPKVKAMQIISDLEPHNRGAYGGCIGFIGFDGQLNQAITIRTFVSRNQQLWLQAGGGIVAHSNEENELQEVNNKLGALRKAIDLAEQLDGE